MHGRALKLCLKLPKRIIHMKHDVQTFSQAVADTCCKWCIHKPNITCGMLRSLSMPFLNCAAHFLSLLIEMVGYLTGTRKLSLLLALALLPHSCTDIKHPPLECQICSAAGL